MNDLHIQLFGAFTVTRDGRPMVGFESDKARALLAFLAVESHYPHRREKLAYLLWPDRPDHTALHNLRQALCNLHHVLGDLDEPCPVLLASPQTVEFNRDRTCWLDTAQFRSLITACEAHNHGQITSCDLCLRNLEQALALYCGEFMQELYLRDSSVFEEWVALHRERLHRLATQALRWLSGGYAERGDHAGALRCAWQFVELDPWCEEAHQQVMRLLHMQGRRSEALLQFRVCQEMLVHELGVDPAPSTRRLFEHIRDEDAVLGPGIKPAPGTPGSARD